MDFSWCYIEFPFLFFLFIAGQARVDATVEAAVEAETEIDTETGIGTRTGKDVIDLAPGLDLVPETETDTEIETEIVAKGGTNPLAIVSARQAPAKRTENGRTNTWIALHQRSLL